jgi:hypothetical protein
MQLRTLSATPGAGRFGLRSSSNGDRLALLALHSDFRRRFLRGRCVPIVQDLQGQDQVQCEAGNVSIENERVVHFLQSGEDSRQRSEQEVEDLTNNKYAASGNVGTYRKRAQLPSSALHPDGENLRELASHSNHPRSGLEHRHGLHVHNVLGEQSIQSSAENGDESGSAGSLSTIVQNQGRDGDVLDRDEGVFAVRAERVVHAHIVRQRDEVGDRLEGVRQEGDAGGRLGGQEVDELRNLDDRRDADDGHAQRLADGELDTVDVGQVDVQDELLVALLAEQAHGGIADGGREVLRDRPDDISEGIHGGGGRWY